MMEKIKEIIPCDITQSDPFFQREYEMRRYDIIQCSHCLEAIASNVEMLHMYIAKLASYVKPGGYLQLLCGIDGGEGYSIPGCDRTLHVLGITPEDVTRGLEMAGEKYLVHSLGTPHNMFIISSTIHTHAHWMPHARATNCY